MKIARKNDADRQYKRNGARRIEWPFGLMPNYFLSVKRCTVKGEGRVGKGEKVKKPGDRDC